MSRQYSPNSATRERYSDTYRSYYDADHESGFGAEYPTDRHRRYNPADEYADGLYATDYEPAYRAETDSDYATEYQYPADYHETLDRRWIWVAGVAGVVLMVAVICTGVILGGGDSGTVTAATTSAAPQDDSAPTPTAAPPAPAADLPGANLSPETVTTVTPTPSATLTPEAAPTAEVAPPAAPAPPVPPAAVDPAAAARTVTYQVTGNRQLIDLVTIIYTDAQGALQTDVNVALPWVKSVTLNPGVTLSSVTATSVAGQLNCAILDGNGTALAVQANDSMIATCTR
ncbi:hypothetical protein ACWDUN_21260 [Mycobacterium sp. NPDC003323]